MRNSFTRDSPLFPFASQFFRLLYSCSLIRHVRNSFPLKNRCYSCENTLAPRYANIQADSSKSTILTHYPSAVNRYATATLFLLNRSAFNFHCINTRFIREFFIIKRLLINFFFKSVKSSLVGLW